MTGIGTSTAESSTCSVGCAAISSLCPPPPSSERKIAVWPECPLAARVAAATWYAAACPRRSSSACATSTIDCGRRDFSFCIKCRHSASHSRGTDGLRALGTLGGQRSSASAISEAGVVVGNAQLEGAAKEDLGHAFIYDSRDANPRLRDLNTVVDASGWILQAANDVNESFIVGYGMRGDSRRAFRIDIASGKVHDLGTIPGGGNSFGWGVDIYGDVVGWAEDATDHNNAFVYSAGLGGLRRLGDLIDPALGWQLVQANSVNAHGMIVGWGYHNGAPRGFKLALPVCVEK